MSEPTILKPCTFEKCVRYNEFTEEDAAIVVLEKVAMCLFCTFFTKNNYFELEAVGSKEQNDGPEK